MITAMIGRQRHQFNEAIDGQIREIYANRLDKRTSALPAATHLARKLGYPKWVILKRARQLGVARAKEPFWSEGELQLLERWAHLSVDVIAQKFRRAGFPRSRTGIHLKLKRLRLRKNTPWYSATALAECFGVDPHSVQRWIRMGYLPAVKKGTARQECQGGDISMIHQDQVRKFVLTHPTEFDLRKVDQLWFLDMITNGKIAS